MTKNTFQNYYQMHSKGAHFKIPKNILHIKKIHFTTIFFSPKKVIFFGHDYYYYYFMSKGNLLP